ncbi:MAG TPA: hypothetical protein VM427_10050 [Patescibacteria group bacterium]|nr:hypothetical protein [Patescibacteria group bacterium]
MRKALRSPVLAVVLVIVFAGTALATAPSGLSAAILSRGTVAENVHFNTGDIKFQTKADVDLVTQTITFAAGATSGWHAHPGVVLVTVASGSLTRYDGNCSSTTYTAGSAQSAFIESGDHAGLVRNETASAAVVYVTYVVPSGTGALRIDKVNPGCGPS